MRNASEPMGGILSSHWIDPGLKGAQRGVSRGVSAGPARAYPVVDSSGLWTCLAQVSPVAAQAEATRRLSVHTGSPVGARAPRAGGGR